MRVVNLRKHEEDKSELKVLYKESPVEATRDMYNEAYKKGRKDERERILEYLRYWWRKYEKIPMEGSSRHTFTLPEDWEGAIIKGTPPYKKDEWQALQKEG